MLGIRFRKFSRVTSDLYQHGNLMIRDVLAQTSQSARRIKPPRVWIPQSRQLCSRETRAGLYLDCIHPLGHSVFTLASRNDFK